MVSLIPESVVVTINGSVLTTQLFSYEENGGERNTQFTKTLHRGHKVSKRIPDDWLVTFSGTTTGKDFYNIYNGLNDNLFPLSIAWAGSYTISFSNVRNMLLTESLEADDRLIFEIEFSAPFYNHLGSKNRVVS